MANPTSQVIRQLRRTVLLTDRAGLPDPELLGAFIDHRDEDAFAALLRRHGPMVWGVCRRLLGHHDAEDAFQAAFLVLFRKAASIRPRGMLPNWLYGVAHQAALEARRAAARRGARERQGVEMPEPAVEDRDVWHDLQPLLDKELSRLPDKYRVAIVLCDLEGKTRTQAAVQLGLPEGTVGSRLARARAMLAKRLARRGIALSGGALAAVLAQQAASADAPAAVVSSTIKAASLAAAGQAAVSAKVPALAEGVLKAMLLSKLKTGAAILLLLGSVALASGLLATNKSQPSREKSVAAMDKGKDGGVLAVSIRSRTARVRVNDPFQVNLRVKNTSATTQSFRVMNCSWDEHWQCSNARVSWHGWDCAKNSAVTVKLEPGEAYEKTLPMLVLAGEPHEKVSFKMGFTPLGSKRTYWSNELTVQVEPDTPARKGESSQGARSLTIHAQIERVDAPSHTITVGYWGNPRTATTPGEENKEAGVHRVRLSDLSVAKNVKIQDGEKNATLADLKVGMAVILELQAEELGHGRGLVVTGIRRYTGPRLHRSKPGAEKPVQPAAKQGKDTEGFTAWGKEVGGLQAGLGFRPGEHRAYHHGETVTLVVLVRNVGKETVKFSYLQPFFEHSLTVAESKGKPVPQPDLLSEWAKARHPREVTLPPGKEIRLQDLKRQLRPARESDRKLLEPYALYATGKIRVQYEQVFGRTEMVYRGGQLDPALARLATGKLELGIKSEPPPAIEK